MQNDKLRCDKGVPNPWLAAEAADRLERQPIAPASSAAGREGRSSARGGLPPAPLRRVLDHIESQLEGDISLHRLAELARLSPYHFARAFKHSTGWAPHRYVLQRRVEQAKAMLADPRPSLAEVGASLGFASQAHFTTTFRLLVGTTPGAYRRTAGRAGRAFPASSWNPRLSPRRRVNA